MTQQRRYEVSWNNKDGEQCKLSWTYSGDPKEWKESAEATVTHLKNNGSNPVLVHLELQNDGQWVAIKETKPLRRYRLAWYVNGVLRESCWSYGGDLPETTQAKFIRYAEDCRLRLLEDVAKAAVIYHEEQIGTEWKTITEEKTMTAKEQATNIVNAVSLATEDSLKLIPMIEQALQDRETEILKDYEFKLASQLKESGEQLTKLQAVAKELEETRSQVVHWKTQSDLLSTQVKNDYEEKTELIRKNNNQVEIINSVSKERDALKQQLTAKQGPPAEFNVLDRSSYLAFNSGSGTWWKKSNGPDYWEECKAPKGFQKEPKADDFKDVASSFFLWHPETGWWNRSASKVNFVRCKVMPEAFVKLFKERDDLLAEKRWWGDQKGIFLEVGDSVYRPVHGGWHVMNDEKKLVISSHPAFIEKALHELIQDRDKLREELENTRKMKSSIEQAKLIQSLHTELNAIKKQQGPLLTLASDYFIYNPKLNRWWKRGEEVCHTWIWDEASSPITVPNESETVKDLQLELKDLKERHEPLLSMAVDYLVYHPKLNRWWKKQQHGNGWIWADAEVPALKETETIQRLSKEKNDLGWEANKLRLQLDATKKALLAAEAEPKVSQAEYETMQCACQEFKTNSGEWKKMCLVAEEGERTAKSKIAELEHYKESTEAEMSRLRNVRDHWHNDSVAVRKELEYMTKRFNAAVEGINTQVVIACNLRKELEEAKKPTDQLRVELQGAIEWRQKWEKEAGEYRTSCDRLRGIVTEREKRIGELASELEKKKQEPNGVWYKGLWENVVEEKDDLENRIIALVKQLEAGPTVITMPDHFCWGRAVEKLKSIANTEGVLQVYKNAYLEAADVLECWAKKTS